jgi:hypothetical protein
MWIRPARPIVIAALVVGALAWPAMARAQTQAPGKFLISGGIGYGSADANCDGCGGDREHGAAGYFRLGFTVAPKVVLGLEANVWAKQLEIESDVTTTLAFYNVSGTVTFYPRNTGLFIRGGAGVALTSMDIDVDGSTISADLGSGPGAIVGVGYDIPVSRRLSITPGVNVWYGRLGELRAVGETFATGWSQNVVDVTIGLTFR